MMKKQRLILLFLLAYSIICSNVFGDGFIIITPPPRPRPVRISPFLLDVRYHHVDVRINGQTAQTFIDQVFYNPSPRRVEGTYLFPVPKGAVIKKFSMFIDGKEYPAELLSAEKARKIYEDIVRKQLDPALLEYQGTGLFKVRIFPIEPHSEKRIKISYSEILNKDNGTVEYLYPLNTEKFSGVPLKEVSINVQLNSTDKIKNIYCPTHEVEIIRHGQKKAKISYEEQNVKPDIDFKLYYNTDRSKIGMSVLTYRQEGEDGYFFLSVAPDFEIDKNEIEEKDIAFVLDVSGSMAGEKLDQAKKALLFCIENLNKGDRFEIIRFSTEAESLFKKLTKNKKESINKARKFVKELNAIGGTNIEEALELALSLKNNNRLYIIVFITDGKPTIGETKENKLLKKIKKANNSRIRIFTFGIGNEINTHLLDKITEMTRAYRSYISPEENIEIKISNFYQKIQSPVMTGLELTFGRNIEVLKSYPKELPDLFKGSSISVIGRYKGEGETQIVLKGKIKNKKKIFKNQFVFCRADEKNDFIPSLWASRRIGHLLDHVRLHGKEKELIDEITQLAKIYGIITPYTSYLILEDEKDLVQRDEISPLDQTLRAVVPKASNFLRKNKKAYSDMMEESGAGSVQASKELQSMVNAENFAHAQQGKSRLGYKDKENNAQNVLNQVRYIQGRAFYNSGSFWVDSYIQAKKPLRTRQIKFADKEYFKLIKKYPEITPFLALGRNVRFVFNNKVYEITD